MVTRQEAIDNYTEKKQAAELAWKAVRANHTDLELDTVLRAKAHEADVALNLAYSLRTKFAPSI